jgi:hypothetical protein
MEHQLGRPKIWIGLALGLLLVPAWARSSGPKTSELALDSSDAQLVKSFNWAKEQALAYAYEGDPVGPWYEAAIADRASFCMRDTAHQAMGAHALGLARQNLNMLRRFAEHMSNSRDWCSYWEIDWMNRPTAVDYKSDCEFWYCLPASFDVLDAACRMYLWSGDSDYVNDPLFVDFYDHTVRDYVTRWQLDLEHVMNRPVIVNDRCGLYPDNYFGWARGLPTYDEGVGGQITLGVDTLATQYAAYNSYALFAAVRGDAQTAQTFYAKAAQVKALVNEKMWDDKTQRYYASLDANHQPQGHAGVDLLYRDVTEEGPKTQGALNELFDSVKKKTFGIEVQSYGPETLYRYLAPDVAYAQIMDLSRDDKERREYPEVSYTVIGAIVSGLIGVRVEPSRPEASPAGAPEFLVRTYPGLTPQTAWAELRHLPVRENKITVRQDGTRETTLTNLQGPELIWKAMLPGAFDSLLVDGRPVKARVEHLPLGHSGSWVRVAVATGKTARVEAPASSKR